MTRSATIGALLSLMIVSGPAAAQSGGDEAWLAGEEQEQPAGEEEPAEGETAGEQDAAVEGEPAPPEGEDTAWLAGKEVKEVEAPEEDTTYQLKEQPDKWYYGIGARFRYIPIPAGEQKWFGVKEAETVHGWGTGIEAIFRHKGLSIIPAVWFAQLARDDVVYRGKDDEWEDTEVWDIDLKMLMVSIEFLASYTIKDWLYLTYGGGFGGIFRLSKGTDKDLIRNEGYHEDGKWHTCDGPDPLAGGNADFCEENGHYDQNWSGWAADPFYPYVDIVVGLRFKPVPNFYVALDTGIVLPLLPLLGVRAGAMF